uniref:Pancreatic trypsin inhibitor n=1 Tax=Rhipicephalus appendiculatus TaxID=34631 RepID=A0A131YUA4_RHIAP
MEFLRSFIVIFLSVTNAYAQSAKGKGSYKQPAVCSKPPDRGPCRANVTYWFFQERYHECKLFNYGGCRGNGNRFWTEKKCYERCAAPDRMKLVCSVHPEPKPCKSTFRAWYFDHRDNACHRLPRGMCTSTANRFMLCEKCMKRCSAENAREACRREYQRIREEENSIKQGQTPALVPPEGAADGTPPGLPSAGAGLPVPKPPLQGATQGQLGNVLGPVAHPPNMPAPVLPVPPPEAAGKIQQSGILQPEEYGGAMSGTTGAAPGAGAPLTTLLPQAQQTGGQDGALPGGSQVVSPTSEGPGLLSETNSLEGGSARRVILVAVIKPTNTANGATGPGPELAEQSGEMPDAKPGIKGPQLLL